MNLLSTYEKNNQDDKSGLIYSRRGKNVKLLALQMTCRIGWREARGREPNAKEIYNKKFMKMDVLDAPESELLMPRTRGKPVTEEALSVGLQLERNFDAAVAEDSNESTTSTRVTLETFGRVTRVGLHVDGLRVISPPRRDAYTAQLEQQVQAMRQESKALRQQSEANRQRIASLEAAQREMQLFMAQFTAS